MAELRRRKVEGTTDGEGPPPASPPQNPRPSSSSGRKPLFGACARLALLLSAITIAFTIYYTFYNTNSHLGSPESPRIYSPSELAQFTGEQGYTIEWQWPCPWPWRQGRILLACLGKVFDVTPGWRHYGPGGGYSFFAGKDGSRAFVTGEFDKDLTDDISGLSPEDLASIYHWKEFYEENQEYKFVGKVIGRFYDKHGEALPLLRETEKVVATFVEEKAAKEAANAAEILCNVSWKKKEGGWVYCNDGLVPRKVRVVQENNDKSGGDESTSSSFGKVQERCICVDSQQEVDEGRKVYDGCLPESSRCQTSPPEN